MALIFQYAAKGFKRVVALWESAQIKSASNAAHLWVRQTVVNFTNPGDNQSAGAHGAWFLGHV